MSCESPARSLFEQGSLVGLYTLCPSYIQHQFEMSYDLAMLENAYLLTTIMHFYVLHLVVRSC